jgi:hypothetical protein
VDIEEWLNLREAMSRAQFEAAHPNPCLLRRRETRRGDARADTERVAFDTGVVMPNAHTTSSPPGLQGAQIFPIVKAPRNPFPERISVGRALNCDIVLREASVSKLHAHFQKVMADEALVTDVKSANGTRVNGKRIGAGMAIRVVSGDLLQLGGVVVQFVSSKALYDVLG